LVERDQNLKHDWPFSEPKNIAVLTLKSIVYHGNSILRVTHDKDDHSWQFLTLHTPDETDAIVVSLEEIVNLDDSINQLSNLPVGWHAWRESKDEPWTIEKSVDN
jgi:hypothetical protein